MSQLRWHRGLLALLVARRVIAPLARLREAVERVPEDRPADADLGAHEDVAEVDAVRDALRTALVRLDASLTQAQSFSRDAAHELRTPLATMLGELDLALELAGLEEREHLVRARRVGQRLASLVERLLVLSRRDVGSEAFEELALRDVVEDAIDALPPDARARVRLEDGDATVRGDRALLAAMIANSLENAVKFSSDPVRVTLGARKGRAIVRVIDHGPGVPAEERQRVFEPFHRTREARASRVPGHGIGLALIRHVAAAHDGSARFLEVAEGSSLEIELPHA